MPSTLAVAFAGASEVTTRAWTGQSHGGVFDFPLRWWVRLAKYYPVSRGQSGSIMSSHPLAPPYSV